MASEQSEMCVPAVLIKPTVEGRGVESWRVSRLIMISGLGLAISVRILVSWMSEGSCPPLSCGPQGVIY